MILADIHHLMKEIRSLVFLGKGAEKLKGFTAIYLLLISAMLTNVVLHRYDPAYFQKDEILNFTLSAPDAFFLVTWAFVIAGHLVVVPLLARAITYPVRFLFVMGGNLFFYSVYFMLTKVMRLKAETKFSFISERELMNYKMHLLGVCHYKEGRIVRSKNFAYYKWYVQNILAPYSKAASGVHLITSLLLSTWIVLHQFQFQSIAPVTYYAVACVSVFYIVNSIAVALLKNDRYYFTDIITTSITHEESLKLQQS